VKLKAAYGGSALPEQCRRVEVYLNDNERRGRGPNLMDYDRAREAGLIQRFNPTLAYFDHLRTLIDFQAIADNPQHLVVDPMFGSGRGQIRGILQGTGCEVHEIRGEMNPGFGGIHPEPIARYLGPLAGAIAAGHGHLGLATDGDADRIGAMDGRGQFVDPHRILALALQYLVEKRGWRGKVVKTISTTQMVNRLAARYGLEVIETPVGFNHIADWMLRDHVLIGGEESGGMSFQGHIPEGDGVLMGLLLVEMVATMNTRWELVAKLLADIGPSLLPRPPALGPGGQGTHGSAPGRRGPRRNRRNASCLGEHPRRCEVSPGGRLLAPHPALGNRAGSPGVRRSQGCGNDGEASGARPHRGRAQALRESGYPLRMVGSSIVNVLPTPGLLLALTRPPCSSTIPLQIASPEPVPCCSCLERSTWWKT
jgi:hypothetical protein